MRHLLLQAMLRVDPLGPDAGPDAVPDARDAVTPGGDGPRPRRERTSLQEAFARSAALASRGTPEAATMSSEAIAAALAVGDDVWSTTGDPVPGGPRLRPDPRQMLALARLAQLLPEAGDVDALLARGSVTLLAVPGEDMRRAVAEDLDELGLLLAGVSERNRARDGNLLVRLVKSAGPGGDAAVERDVAGGAALLLAAAGREVLPEAARMVVGRTMAWPDPGADTVIEVLRVTHSETGAVAEEALRAILPASDRLAQLPAALWARAWTERTTLQVARALASSCEWLPRRDADARRHARPARGDGVARGDGPRSRGLAGGAG